MLDSYLMIDIRLSVGGNYSLICWTCSFCIAGCCFCHGGRFLIDRVSSVRNFGEAGRQVDSRSKERKTDLWRVISG